MFTESQARHIPTGGRWATFAGVSIVTVPVIALVPDAWKTPLVVVSMIFLALSLAALTLTALRERSDHR